LDGLLSLACLGLCLGGVARAKAMSQQGTTEAAAQVDVTKIAFDAVRFKNARKAILDCGSLIRMVDRRWNQHKDQKKKLKYLLKLAELKSWLVDQVRTLYVPAPASADLYTLSDGCQNRVDVIAAALDKKVKAKGMDLEGGDANLKAARVDVTKQAFSGERFQASRQAILGCGTKIREVDNNKWQLYKDPKKIEYLITLVQLKSWFADQLRTLYVPAPDSADISTMGNGCQNMVAGLTSQLARELK
jgi:hypothetical protein